MAKKRYVCTCVTCGSEFEAARDDTRFCQPRCQRYEHTCEDCGRPFTARSNRAKRCDACAGPWRRERPEVGPAFAPVKARPGPSRTKKLLREERQHRRANIDVALRSRTDEVVTRFRAGGQNRTREAAA